ncbi:MAG: alanine racemase [Pleurocapsa sp.]
MPDWRQQIKLESQNKGLSLSSLVSRQRAWVEIDLTALATNVRSLKKLLSPQTELMAVVKADAYGHGAIAVAQTALQHGASSLAIATLVEGVELRQAGLNAPILILGAINAPEDIKAVAAWQLEPTICHPQQALIFSETLQKTGTTLPVHLKLDTGMSRLGTDWQQAKEFVELVQKLPNLRLKSVYSHLATADDPDPTVMNLQHQRFRSAIAELKSCGIHPPYLHLANSAATLSDRSCHYDLVRIGLALYGLHPSPHLSSTVKLKPVLQVKAKITQVKTLAAGTGVSYGHRYITDKETKVAVLGIGYADGVPRNLSQRLQAIVRGRLVSQIGTITMDQMMLDVDGFEDLRPGEIVTLIGTDGNITLTADDWADKLNTISWEILCGFKHRLPRVYQNVYQT